MSRAIPGAKPVPTFSGISLDVLECLNVANLDDTAADRHADAARQVIDSILAAGARVALAELDRTELGLQDRTDI